MPGGCRLRSRGCLLAPPSQSLALSTGSQLTAVSGNTSSWKNSFCREGGRDCPEALTRGPGHTSMQWERGLARPGHQSGVSKSQQGKGTGAPKSSEEGNFGTGPVRPQSPCQGPGVVILGPILTLTLGNRKATGSKEVWRSRRHRANSTSRTSHSVLGRRTKP